MLHSRIDPPPPASSPTTRTTPLPVHDARDLTGPEGLARIHLDDQVYTLRITRQGKLILTK